jgi:hypothetical protein
MATVADSRVTLDMLPDELMLAIIEHMALPALLNFNLVSKRLYRLTLENVYAMFPGPNAACFLRTITLPPPTGRPELAMLVKSVVWTSDLGVMSYHPAGSPPMNISASDRWAIARAYQQLELVLPAESQVSLDSRFASHVRGIFEENDWALEFFLMFVPNVEELKVHGAWQWDDHTYWFTNVAANPTRFNRLKSIEIHGPMRINNIIPLLTMPSLKNLDLEQVIVMRRNEEGTFPWWEPTRRVLEDASSGLEKLTLAKSHIPASSLASILKAIRGLKHFRYEHVINYLSHPPHIPIPLNYNKLAPALADHLATLEQFYFEDQQKSISLNGVMTTECYQGAATNGEVGPPQPAVVDDA